MTAPKANIQLAQKAISIQKMAPILSNSKPPPAAIRPFVPQHFSSYVLSTYKTAPSPSRRKYEALSLKQTYLNYISKQKAPYDTNARCFYLIQFLESLRCVFDNLNCFFKTKETFHLSRTRLLQIFIVVKVIFELF